MLRPGPRRTGVNALVARLLSDRAFLSAFRADPRKWADAYRVTDEQLDALLESDEARLIALGLDPKLVEPHDPRAKWLPGALLRMGRAGVAFLAAFSVLASGPAVALAAPPSPRAGERARARRTFIRARFVRARARYNVHPLGARRAVRANGRADARAGRRALYFRSERAVRRFARAGVFGYIEQDNLFAALKKVDPNIVLLNDDGGGQEPPVVD